MVDLWVVAVVVIVSILLGGALVFFLVKRINNIADETIYIPIEKLGICQIRGNREKEYSIIFNGGTIEFLVENGIITGYKPEKAKDYIKY
jgi:uncharacterized membrane protein YqiK